MLLDGQCLYLLSGELYSSEGCCTVAQTGLRPAEAPEATAVNAKDWWLLRTITAHPKALAGVAVHPTTPIAVTSSDDCTWRMWHLPSCEQIMTGEGHAGWVSGLDFHPKVPITCWHAACCIFARDGGE